MDIETINTEDKIKHLARYIAVKDSIKNMLEDLKKRDDISLQCLDSGNIEIKLHPHTIYLGFNKLSEYAQSQLLSKIKTFCSGIEEVLEQEAETIDFLLNSWEVKPKEKLDNNSNTDK